MAWIQNTFNSWVGSNTTYVANAYPKDVWVYFHTQKVDINSGTLDVSSSVSAQIQFRLKKQPNIEKVKVDFNDFFKKRRTDSRMFLSVFTTDEERAPLCENYEISPNRSIIVTKTGQIKPQKYGGNIWTDEFDVNHKA